MEAIVALATSPIKSALHIIRMSGSNVFEIISDIFSKKINYKKREINIGYILEDKNIIDQVVLLTYPAPNSYTGEDVAEIITHGNVLIDNEIINLTIRKGARMASNGEFTSRAFLNHKLDLVQAEAINDLINATTIESKNIITHALKGETSLLLQPLKKGLIDLISNLEVNIDYPEYKDIEQVNRQRIAKDLNKYRQSLNNLIENGQKGLIIKEGIKVAIVGKPNVGKSTLLNALIKEDKAIVSNIPGTTRDIVEGEINIDGILLHLLDTAGLRSTHNKIESIGVKKTYDIIKKADIVIHLKDDPKDLTTIKGKIDIEVINKADLIKKKDKNHIYISAKQGKIDELIEAIKKKIGLSNDNFNKASFANARELGLFKRAVILIDDIINENKKNTPIDIILTMLHELLDIILEVFGEKASLDLTKEIFSRFCVGK